ncbi:MAG: ABC transporter substrate-binding protein [Bacteroidales bacterium]|nr:ABC transporter substrate-binding protein [Bacteroidales bacterium]
MIKRIPILLIIFLLSAQLGISQEQALKKVNFLPLWIPQPQFAGYYMAKEAGIYKKYGLDVNIIHGGFVKDVPVYLKEERATFGIMYLSSAIKERAKGIPLVNVGQIFQSSDIMFVSKKKSGIKSIKDFSGKKIAVWRTVLEELTVGFLKKHQIKADVIRINEGVNIFLKDAVDICAVMYYNEYNNLINFGINPDELNVFYLRDYGMDFPEDGIYCLESTYGKDPKMCDAFVKASIEGWNYAFLHPQESLNVLKKYQKQEKVIDNKAHAEWMLEAMKSLIKPAGKKVRSGELLINDYRDAVQFLKNNKEINTETEFSLFYRGAIK